MKTKSLTTITTLAVCCATLIGTSGLRATTMATPQALTVSTAPVGSQFETIAFSDSAEATMLMNAYDILASSDHDYGGHRGKAMHEVEDAAKLLGVKLRGDGHDRQHQVVSDEKMQSAADMLTHVLTNAEVKGQPRISKHVSEAINQINLGLIKK